MPSKANIKGSSAKNQAKPVSQDIARAGPGSDVKSSTETTSPAANMPATAKSKQLPHPHRPEADVLDQQSNRATTQPAVDELIKDGAVNRKKQKRRMKEAAKRAAEDGNLSLETGKVSNRTYQPTTKQMLTYDGKNEANGYEYEASDYDDQDRYELDEPEDMYYTDEAAQPGYSANHGSASLQLNGHASHDQGPEGAPGGKSKKKKKNKPSPAGLPAANAAALPRPPPPPPPTLGQAYLPPASQHGHHVQKDPSKIWNTSTTEERERIKEFWLSLGEDERRSLVKVEKEAVLKKMKEQQKHSCSCTVCGRKRTAIEEELEVLYDAYYEELEQYANHQQISLEDGAPIMARSRLYHPMSRQRPQTLQAFNEQNSRGRIQDVGDGGDAGDEDEDSEAGEDDEISDDYDNPEAPPQNSAATDFFNFGNSLTVQGASRPTHKTLQRADESRGYTNRCRRPFKE